MSRNWRSPLSGPDDWREAGGMDRGQFVDGGQPRSPGANTADHREGVCDEAAPLVEAELGDAGQEAVVAGSPPSGVDNPLWGVMGPPPDPSCALGALVAPFFAMAIILVNHFLPPTGWFGVQGWWLLAGMVLFTSVLLAQDAAQLRRAAPFDRTLPTPLGVLFSVACLWIFSFPGYYLDRGKRLRPQWGPVALLGVVCALISFRFLPVRQLPAADSPEVIRKVESAIRLAGLVSGEMQVEGHQEVRYESSPDRRTGQCVVRSGGASQVVEYHVEWNADTSDPVYVHAWTRDLPTCNSLLVQSMIKRNLESLEEFRGLRSVEEVRELKFDVDRVRRWGSCQAVLPDRKVPLWFVVEWHNRSEGQFHLQLFPIIPDRCDSPQTQTLIAALLEDLSSQLPPGVRIERPEGFVEVEYHAASLTRVGECTAKVNGQSFRFRFEIYSKVVDFQPEDVEQGVFNVRLLGGPRPVHEPATTL